MKHLLWQAGSHVTSASTFVSSKSLLRHVRRPTQPPTYDDAAFSRLDLPRLQTSESSGGRAVPCEPSRQLPAFALNDIALPLLQARYRR